MVINGMTYIGIIIRRSLHGDAKNTVLKIGNVRVPLREAKRPELVPTGIADKNLPPSLIHALKWLIQKDALQQDVFLIGVPGYLRSFVVFSYLDLTNREFEYLSVTRDTTEADIKQRREISGGNAFYSDLCAVRAALHGRVLVIDGVEKAERNVLPILNNLLENREMQLDDGRFLMAARKYDRLREKYSEEELQKMKLERVSENFHVIALGLPVPTFKGHTLDPPLRSRFQCKNIAELPFETMSQLCSFLAPIVGVERVNNLLALVYGLNSQNTEKTGIALPLFPTDNLLKSMKIWNINPSFAEENIFNLSYPRNSILKEENQLPILEEYFKNFSTTRENKKFSKVKEIIPSNNSAAILAQFDGKNISFEVPAGSCSKLPQKHEFVSTKAHESLLSELILTHSTADFCLLGPKGSGKTTILEEFSRRLGYETENIVLFQDMNSRELVQSRRMLSNGDTVWEDSQLVTAMKKGSLCILDGLEKIHWSTAEMLAPLLHHRYLQLPDGSRLIGAMYYDAMKAKTGFSDELLAQKGVYKIAENFRLVALADSESVNSSKWLNDQILSMFMFHTLKPMSIKEQCEVISRIVPNVNKEVSHRLVSFVERLRGSTDAAIRGIAISLSLRRLIYILRRYTHNLDEGIFDGVHRAALSRFMPSLTRSAFDKALNDAGIVPDSKAGSFHDDSWKERLMETSSKKSVDSVEHESMVPDIVFFDNKQHLKVMNDMAKDFELGSHLFVIGNQGVGKNKITDRFLQLIKRQRQYMQLHRDTTVQSLTIQTTVIDGILKHEDSPLVKAVRDGLVLVIDEADKAPLTVVAVLKSLIDSGILYLSDGRRIQPSGFPVDSAFEPITIHPDFRLIMLANRPGFPFLGNDLFAVLGDLFSIHIVDNPSRASELVMLKQYGPNVPDEQLNQLVSAFDELREMADNSLLSYPYSTRELVNIVKHLQLYPDDPLTAVVRNVFDFDSYTKETSQSIEAVFQKYGIPLGIKKPEENVFLSRRFPIEEPRKLGEWKIKENSKPFLIEPKIVPLISEKEYDYKKYAFNLEMHHSRASHFSEQKFCWQLPTSDVNICSDILEFNGKICVATVNPPTLYYIPDPRRSSCIEIDLSQQFSKFTRGEFRPRITLGSWNNSSSVLVHEETTNTLLLIDFEKLKIHKLGSGEGGGMIDSIVGKFSSSSLSNGMNHWRLINHPEHPILFSKGGNQLQIIFPGDLSAGVEIISLPDELSISNILPASKDKFLIETNKGTFLLTFESDGRVFLRSMKEDSDIPLHFDTINKMQQQQSQQENPAYILSHEDYYAIKSENFSELMSGGEVVAWKKSATEKCIQAEVPYRSLQEKFPLIHPQKEVAIFENGVSVRALPKWKVPEKALPKDVSPTAVSGFLEVFDPRRSNVQYIPVPSGRSSLYHSSWIASITKAPFTLAKGSDGKSLYTCEMNGAIRKWEIDEIELMSSLQAWHKLFGAEDPNERIEFERDESQVDMSKLTEPTLGKFDPKNTPHVGGNMWQGGTGGYNTAGLGGVGGPFRLDAGHDVHQIAEAAKGQVPEEYKKKAREINRREYQKRLKDIDMSEHDAKMYEEFQDKIKKQVTHMKSIIDSLEARENERQWVKHQTSGDLDDAKLIEGLTGEKGIYRKRMELPPEVGAIQTKPKRLRLVFDVSGSMYRFNGHDKRLQRSMEAALMVMDALDGKQDKVKYDIVGHSGDGPELPFTSPEKPPSDEKQKFDVAKKMFLQSQFCYSGDFTLEALEMAISKLSKETDVDERFVIVLSDANLDRYGIKAHHLAKKLEADPKVHAFVILVGSLGSQAEKLVKALPAGKAFYASDTAQLPHIIQNIFASTLIK